MDNRGSFLFFVLAFYLLVNSQVRAPLIDHDGEYQRQIAAEKEALQQLNESKYGDFEPLNDKWLPFSGLRTNDSYSWDLLSDVQATARRHLDSVLEAAGIVDAKDAEETEQSTSLNLTEIKLPVYNNVTGKLRGDWVRRKKEETLRRQQSRLNVTALVLENEYVTHDFGLNITGDTGTMYLDLSEGEGEELESTSGHVREIRAEVAIESASSLGSTWYMTLYGLHFTELGHIVLTTTTDKFGGVFSLPHFTLSEDLFNVSHRLLVQSLSDTIARRRNSPPAFFPWSSLPHGQQPMAFPAAPRCEYIMYLQQHPVTLAKDLIDRSLLEQIEDELRFPMGAPIPPPPLLQMSAVLFSPDCAHILETKGPPEFPPTDSLYLVGPKHEEYAKYAARLMFAVAGVSIAQIFLLLRQIKEASTPSTRSRISYYTIAMMSFGEAVTIVFTLITLATDTSFLILTATAFICFLSVSYIGMRFMMEIWAVQAPERREDRPTAAPQAPTRPPGLPPPVTAARAVSSGATPIILPPDQDAPEDELTGPTTRTPGQTDAGTDVGTMYARFYFILCCCLIVSLWSLLWPNRLSAIYARILGFIYLSFWIPQIYRNIMRNCRKALRWDFVIGQSILRLFPFVYYLTVPGNVLFIRSDWTTALAMVGWVWVQVWALVSQDILGPRFFVPKGWAPPAYDYHPIIRDSSPESGDDLESGSTLPIGFLRAEERDAVAAGSSVGAGSGSKDGDRLSTSKDPSRRKKKIFDCAICMQDIEVPVASGSSGGGVIPGSMTDGASSILGRRAYMVTPCRHIFHSACLESWMRLRLQCPICRESIPPV